jgi:hypothetical protein
MADHGLKVPFLPKDPSMYFGKSTTIFGASRTGKSTIALEILHLLKDKIPMINIFSPTESENKTYSGTVPNEVIFPVVELEKLEAIYRRQKGATKVYNMVNNKARLRQLFMKVSTVSLRETEMKVTQNADDIIYRKQNDMSLDVIQKKNDTVQIKKSLSEYLVTLYKHVIRSNRRRLRKLNLTDPEMYVLRYLDFNPEVLIIFDDCASQFSLKMQKSKIIQDMFFLGRHLHMTSLFLLHDDKQLESSLRKNSFVNIFTTAQCAHAYFDRGSNNFSKDEKKRASTVISHVLNPQTKKEFKKLVYVRDSDVSLRYTIAGIYDDFRFGSSALWTMCEKLRIASERFNPEDDEMSAFKL